jgi:hypothetical protein
MRTLYRKLQGYLLIPFALLSNVCPLPACTDCAFVAYADCTDEIRVRLTHCICKPEPGSIALICMMPPGE